MHEQVDPVTQSSRLCHRPRGARLGRLREMSFAEVAYRGHQETAKLIERMAAPGRYPDPAVWLQRRAPAIATASAALRFERDTLPGRFFGGASDHRARSALRERLPVECLDLVCAATGTMVGRRFDLLGYRMLSFGDPINWHFDPVCGRQSPLVHWSRIDALDPSVVGDSKVIWELNRHQWVVTLAQAWALTGDEQFARTCIGSIDAWLEANPPATGINWTSSLEVAYRLISWCWTLALLHDFPGLSGEWMMKVVSAIGMHAAHVRRYLSYYFSPNTHLTGEALGLFYAGTLFTEFLDAPRWRELGARILVAESRRQVSADGVHFEQSTCYHRYTVDIYLHFLLLASSNGVGVPGNVVDRVRQMVEFLLAVRQPDGSIPAIGDVDGGTLLPLSCRRPEDAAGTFATAAAMFHRSDFAWAANGVAPEILWLMGLDGLRAFDALHPVPPAGPASRAFAVGGYAIMRNQWDDDASQMIVDIGPLGCPGSGGHGHADLLSVQCAIFGEPCLVDGGNFCYTPDAEWRDFFRSTAAHSTLVIDGRTQSEPAGPFGWRDRPRVRLREWHSSPEVDFLDAEHDAFSRRGDPIVHRRRILFVKPRYWILVDDLAGTSEHQVDLTFQFAPLPVALGPDRWARVETPRGHALWVRPFTSAATRIRTRLESGARQPIRGWVAPTYGERRPAPMLIYSTTIVPPWRVLTLLLPDADGLSSPPSVRLVYDEDHRPAGLFIEDSGETVRVDDGVVLVTRE